MKTEYRMTMQRASSTSPAKRLFDRHVAGFKLLQSQPLGNVWRESLVTGVVGSNVSFRNWKVSILLYCGRTDAFGGSHHVISDNAIADLEFCEVRKSAPSESQEFANLCQAYYEVSEQQAKQLLQSIKTAVSANIYFNFSKEADPEEGVESIGIVVCFKNGVTPTAEQRNKIRDLVADFVEKTDYKIPLYSSFNYA